MREIDIKQHNIELDKLEGMLDYLDFCPFVELLAEVCSAKADHVRGAWQDETMGRIWDCRAAYLLEMSDAVCDGVENWPSDDE